jgi:hypothetical protein
VERARRGGKSHTYTIATAGLVYAMATSLTSLSSEVLLRILGNLDDARDVVRFRRVSRRMNGVGGDSLVSVIEDYRLGIQDVY